jgi:wyosine [tRNA(Phe)-imidazoG37] synthetase (radical SAM superfamily)
MILELKKGLTYGPVRSRRLGASLGINLFPGSTKRCPFDCVYCQYGWTPETAARLDAGAVALPSPADVEKAVRQILEELAGPPAYLTFSGNGEPTLHPHFPAMVDRVNAVRTAFGGQLRTAVLSNSARVMDPDILEALARLDVRIMKLDCGTESVFQRYNRPAPEVTLEDITEGLRRLAEKAPVTIQSLVTAGPDGNLGEKEASAWAARLAVIKPAAVQLYTLARGCPSSALSPAPRAALAALATAARARGLAVTVF